MTEVPAGFALDAPWRLHPKVAVRRESFGALLYHYDTRRLSFLKNTTMLAVVTALEEYPTARQACAAAGVSGAELPAYRRALGALAASAMIERDTR